MEGDQYQDPYSSFSWDLGMHLPYGSASGATRFQAQPPPRGPRLDWGDLDGMVDRAVGRALQTAISQKNR